MPIGQTKSIEGLVKRIAAPVSRCLAHLALPVLTVAAATGARAANSAEAGGDGGYVSSRDEGCPDEAFAR